MYRKKFIVHLTILALIVGAGCSSLRFNRDKLYRNPANDPSYEVTNLRSKELLRTKIYEYNGLMAIPPFRWIAQVVIKSKVYNLLDDLPLKPAVRARIKSRVRERQFSKQIVPFLLAMKDLYMAKDSFKSRNFKNHILKYFPDYNSIPGLKHSLFTYGEEHSPLSSKESNEGESKGLSKIFIAKIVTLADAILFENSQFTLGQRADITQERVDSTKVVVKELFEEVISEFKLEPMYREIIEGIINTPHRLEAMSISLIELLENTFYKNYQMLAQRYHRENLLKNWMMRELEKTRDSQLWDFIDESLNDRRYAVHIVVDGLQGQLIESLANGSRDKFIKRIYNDHKKQDSYKPKEVKSTKAPGQQVDFLKYLNKRSHFSHSKFLPFFKDLYKNNISGISKNGISTTPTISVRNIPMATVGAGVEGEGGTRLPNFHYVDREKDRAYYFFGNDALRFEDINKERNMKTLSERLPHLSSLSCSSQWGGGTDFVFDPFVNIAAGEVSRDFGEIICMADLERRLKNEKRAVYLRQQIKSYKRRVIHWLRTRRIQRNHRMRNPIPKVRALIQELAEVENQGMPSYFLFYLPWPDHYAHFKGPFSDEIIGVSGELNRLDYWLGRVTDVYKRAGVYDKTLWGMVGDHGLAPIYYYLNPEVVVFDKMIEEGIPLKVRKISSDEGEGPKLNHPTRPISAHGEDAIIASTAGGNFMIDLFKDQSFGWDEQPVLSEIQDLELISGTRINMINELVMRLEDSLEYAVVRERECNLESTDVVLLRKEGEQIISANVKRRGERVFYKSENDILQVKELSPYREIKNKTRYENLLSKCLNSAVESNVDSWCFEDEWRELTSYTAKPDSINQMAHIYDSDLAGTINLFPKEGIGYNTKVPGRHAGEHFHEKDAFVGVWGAPVKSQSRVVSYQNGSVPVVLYEYLSGSRTTKGQNGWGYESFIDKLDLDL